MEKLLERRSCRKFIRNEAIPKENLEKILNAAQNYPCAMGYQEVDFFVLTNQTKIDDLSAKIHENTPEFKKYLDGRITNLGVKDSIWCDAPCVVFLVSNGEQSGFKEINMGEAAMSIISIANEMGYSTLPVLMCSNPNAIQYTAEVLGVPAEKLGLSIAIGKAHENWKPGDKKLKSEIKWME